MKQTLSFTSVFIMICPSFSSMYFPTRFRPIDMRKIGNTLQASTAISEALLAIGNSGHWRTQSLVLSLFTVKYFTSGTSRSLLFLHQLQYFLEAVDRYCDLLQLGHTWLRAKKAIKETALPAGHLSCPAFSLLSYWTTEIVDRRFFTNAVGVQCHFLKMN